MNFLGLTIEEVARLRQWFVIVDAETVSYLQTEDKNLMARLTDFLKEVRN